MLEKHLIKKTPGKGKPWIRDVDGGIGVFKPSKRLLDSGGSP